MYDQGKYHHLYSDRGEYGYGKDLLFSKYTPASTFKLYNALAAVDAGLTDVTHNCTREGYLPDDPDKSWKNPRTKKNKPIICYRDESGRPGRHGRGITFEKAITKSCNQYFARLAIEGDNRKSTHPEALTRMCKEEELYFGWPHKARDGSDLQCKLAEPGTRDAGLNGFGQSVVMDVYQIAALLQVVSSNKSPTLERYAFLQLDSEEELPVLDSLSLLDGDGIEKILRAMQAHSSASFYTELLNTEDGIEEENHIRVYGKTGTGDRLLSVKEHHRPRKGDFIEEVTKKNGETVWIEDLERAYGVTEDSNVALFVSLVEKAENPAAQVGTNRVGIVVRVPRSIPPDGSRVSGGSVAAPISLEIIRAVRDLGLLDEPSEE